MQTIKKIWQRVDSYTLHTFNPQRALRAER